MSTALETAQVTCGANWLWRDTLTISDTLNQGSTGSLQPYTTGTGADQANKIFVNQYSIAASGNQQLDLAGGVVDYANQTITFTKIKEIYIALTADTTASSILVGGGTDGAGTNALVGYVANASDMIRVGNGRAFTTGRSDATGFPVTAGTGDILRILNEDGSNVATVNVVIIGVG